MSEEELLKKYEEMDYILHLSDGYLWQDILRTLGGGIVFLLSWLNDFIEGIIDKIITFNNFYSSGPMKEFMDVARPVVWGVFFIALFVLGFQFMLNKIEKRNEVILNIILALCFIVVLPDLMSNLGQITNQGIKTLNPESESLAGELVKSNVADVLYYAERGFNYSSNKNGNESSPPRPQSKGNTNLGTTDFTYANKLPKQHTWVYIPYTQKLDVHDKKPKALENLSDGAIEVLSHRAIPTGNGTGKTVEELQKNVMMGTGSLGRESYYRYHVNWMVLIASLLVTTIALVITVIKIGRSIFDLAFHQIYGMFIAATDLTGGQRTKKVLTEIISTFAVIFIMTMLLKFFMMYSVWANGLKSSIGSIGVLLLLIAGAWALIDAPDIVQRTLGIDAGLRSGWQAMMGAYAGARTAGVMGGAIGKATGAVTKGVTGGANFSKRTVEGMFTKTPEEKESEFTKASVKQIPGTSGISLKQSSAQTENQVPNVIQTDTKSIGFENASSQIQPVPDQSVDSETYSINDGQNIQHLEKENLQIQKGTRINKTEPIPSQKSSLHGTSEKIQNSKGMPNKIVPPSGYGQTKTGILIPQSELASSENSTLNPSAEQTGKTISETVSPEMTSMQSGSKQETINASKGSGSNYGHQEAIHQNTWIGGNRRVQSFKENWVRAGNSGFDLGQNIRRIGRGSGKAVLKTTKAVIQPRETLQKVIDKTKVNSEVRDIKMPPKETLKRKGSADE